MSHLEFVLPVQRDDLCNTARNQYVVNEIIPLKNINGEAAELQRILSRDGVDFIFLHFDTFFSVLRHFPKIENEVRIDVWQVIISAAAVLSNQMSFLEDGVQNLEYHARSRYRNMLKMIVYILCQMGEAFEVEVSKPSTEAVVSGVKGGKKRPKKKDDSSWEDERMNFVAVLLQLYQLPVHILWEPPIVEEEFMCLATNCCFKMLENVNVTRNKSLKDSIFSFLGLCLKRKTNSLGYSVKIIQLLQDYEHLVSPLAQAVSLFVIEYDSKNLICEIIREIGYIEMKDLSRDTVGVRSLSLFIVEVATKCPKEVLSSVSLLLPYLDEESHTMRNCVLSVLCEIVCKVLNKDGLEERSKELRDKILDKLEEHIHDVSAFVRSKCLQIWKQLCSEQCIPLPRQHNLLELIIGRLHDKSCSVRKHAIQFLTVFLQRNPYTARLSLEELTSTYEKEKNVLKEMTVDAEKVGVVVNGEIAADVPLEDDVQKALNFDEGESDIENENAETEKESSENAMIGSTSNVVNQEEVIIAFKKQQLTVNYLKNTMKFAEQIAGALSLICDYLKSKTMSDVLEAVSFYVTAFQFGVKGAVTGVKQMLHLVWSKENTIKEAIVGAYKVLYLVTEGVNRRTEAVKVAQNLINFLRGATISEIASIEELIKEFVKTGDISSHVIKVLWENFTMKLPETTDEESYSSLMLLSMAAGYQPEIVSSNVDNLISIGLGPRAVSDFSLAKETCLALMKMKSSSKPDTESKDPPFRFKETHDLFVRLSQLLVEGIRCIENSYWVPMAEQAVNVIYNLADHPDKICVIILKRLAGCLVETHNFNGPDSSVIECSSILMCRFISICGHIALSQVLLLEAGIIPELKRRQNLKENRRDHQRASLNKSLMTPLSKASEDDETSAMVGATADDAETEFIRKVCEMELLNENNLLGIICPLILCVARDPSKFPNPDLCSASSLALAKCMLVSSVFCENNMPLLITVMEKSSEPVTRANIIVALGDLATRFPNIVEPWTPNLYGRLKDPSVHVRNYTMNVLTHLILHDMIKVKGQISDMALCIVDEEDQISEMAKFFFLELSKKGNAVYNIIPDIISHLSDPDCGTSEENFETIMRFLFQFIQKERQIESLVEKLCHRFRAARTDTQCYEIAFCMSQLAYNEKSLNKLHENIQCFGDKIKDPVVRNHFTNILNAAKKNSNPKAESEIESLFKLLEI